MDPRLLAAASKGDLDELRLLLNRSGDTTAVQPNTADIERGTNVLEMPTPMLLKCVTAAGDTLLHVVAANGDSKNFLDCASVIRELLFAQNKEGDTPLHCAARAGNFSMVKHLISLVGSGGKTTKYLLRMENHNKETALHDATRAANNSISIVKKLLETDRELACFPKDHGTSPMYLAVLLNKVQLAETLHNESEGDLSYCGPNGQNALHAAVFRSRVLTEKLLEWKKDLAEGTDENGSTPLHFAVALRGQWCPPSLRWFRPAVQWFRRRKETICPQVFEANMNALFQSDGDGSYPIHVAASLGRRWSVANFIYECPSSAGLRDAKRRTFLHIAVGKKQVPVVRYACRNPSLSWIMNMQDKDGNTALHLAVMSGNLNTFAALFGNKQVDLNLTNAEGKTPLDIAKYKVPPSFSINTNSEDWMRDALVGGRATIGIRRQDRFIQDYKSAYRVGSDYEAKELDMLKESTQSRSIGSVLIATVTFGAMFALPGGYIQDDHRHGGAPTLAGRYAFHAFLLANTTAFVFSTMATIGFMYSGSARQNLESRKWHFRNTLGFLHKSIMAMTAAFALGVYTMLSPVAPEIAITICVISPLVVVYNFAEFWLRCALFVEPFRSRMGLLWIIRVGTGTIVVNLIWGLWMFVAIFAWAAYASNHISM